jgi:N-acetylglutamate synthase-like GNAT family acetyltransferase
LWVGAGRHTVDAESWVALSGVRHVDYNVALCHGGDGRAVVTRALEAIAAAGTPALILLAGRAVGAAQALVDAGWICVGETPVMVAGTSGRVVDPAVRRLDANDLPAVHELVADAFRISTDHARSAVPDRALADPSVVVYGLDLAGRLVACLTTVQVDDVAVIWSTATASARQHRGHGRQLLEGVLADARAAGAEAAALYSSSSGMRLYASAGFEVVEHLQMWSRPRWVLAG